MEEKVVNMFYLCLHQRLKDNANRNGEISKKEFFRIVMKIYRIPKNLRYVILREMKNLHLLEELDTMNLKIAKTNQDLKDTSKIFKDVGLSKVSKLKNPQHIITKEFFE